MTRTATKMSQFYLEKKKSTQFKYKGKRTFTVHVHHILIANLLQTGVHHIFIAN